MTYQAKFCNVGEPLPRSVNVVLKRFANHERAFAISAATVGKLAAHPPVPRCKSLVAVCGTACGDDDSPDVTSPHELELPNED